MYSFTTSQTIAGDVDRVWNVWADPDRFPAWDPREERTRLNGPFAVGSTIDSKQKGNPAGTVTITAVQERRRWTASGPLPGGELVIDHTITAAGPGRVTVTKRYDVTGPLTALFRLYYAPKVRRAMPATFAALETETARRG
ncbi:MAG: SRPBCC family protein [Actinomycetota bacterium]|nr:SRPBCC family protein [Actinomycetota bacterium]